MRKIELVFRTIGERTSEIALELAIKYIQPNKIHVINNVRPFSKAFQDSINIDFEADYVVFMDADCLIFEDMRQYIENTNLAYIDCYVFDKFRGKLHAGVHITRMDVVIAMRSIAQPTNDKEYDLRPESWTRMHALRQIDEDKSIKQFKILHDYYQSFTHIFTKYVLRGLRSRSEFERLRFQIAKNTWKADDLDFIVADYAIKFSSNLDLNNPAFKVESFLLDLPNLAIEELARLKIKEKNAFDESDIDKIQNEEVLMTYEKTKNRKIFGIGLSRTGTKSLTRALNILGYVVSHYPTDSTTYMELTQGSAKLSILDDIDALTDITVAPYIVQLDKLYPNSKFILTVREKGGWLKSLERHWQETPIYDNIPDREDELNMKRFLRAAVYGTYQYNEERLSYVYDTYLKSVVDYFKDKPGKLLIIDITKGDGWNTLCPFLGFPILEAPFPNVQIKSKLRELLSRAI